jgi:PII-like signaling protein
MAALSGSALRVTVYVGADDVHHHRPLYSEIVVRARESGLAGATVVRGIEGFGRRSLVHTSRLVSLSSDLPVVIEIVDEPAKVRAFLGQLDDIVHGGLVTVEEVEVHRYVGLPRSEQQ